MPEACRLRGSSRTAGFSLIELVIVIVIMGVLAAVALPRMIKSADNADEKALQADFTVLNKALEFYAAEHRGAYPTGPNVQKQLTMCTDVDGNGFSEAPDRANGTVYGPYLVMAPPLPMGPNAGATGIATVAAPGVGWLYRPSRPIIIPNFTNGGGNVPWQYEQILEDLAPGEANAGEEDET